MTTKQDIVLDQIATVLNKLRDAEIVTGGEKLALFKDVEEIVKGNFPDEKATPEQIKWNMEN